MKSLKVVLPVTIMILLGGLYAWSLFVPYLNNLYGLTASQTQFIFGLIITTYTASMLWGEKLIALLGFKGMVLCSALFFATGYLLASFSGGNFYVILLGIGFLSGVGTGLGYVASISIPANWFPEKKGTITGLVAAGFAAGSILLTFAGKALLNNGMNVLMVFRYIGIVYGIVLLIIAFVIPSEKIHYKTISFKLSLNIVPVSRMFIAIFFGTFAGLLVIGNISLFGNGNYSANQLSYAIILFAIANISGRIIWGWLCDKYPTMLLLTIALVSQGVSTYIIGNIPLSISVFYVLVLVIGAGFGANFVVFVHETASIYGTTMISRIYPMVFLGYGIAGIVGPLTGGILFDVFGNFKSASLVSAITSIAGVLVFAIRPKKKTTHHTV